MGHRRHDQRNQADAAGRGLVAGPHDGDGVAGSGGAVAGSSGRGRGAQPGSGGGEGGSAEGQSRSGSALDELAVDELADAAHGGGTAESDRAGDGANAAAHLWETEEAVLPARTAPAGFLLAEDTAAQRLERRDPISRPAFPKIMTSKPRTALSLIPLWL